MTPQEAETAVAQAIEATPISPSETHSDRAARTVVAALVALGEQQWGVRYPKDGHRVYYQTTSESAAHDYFDDHRSQDVSLVSRRVLPIDTPWTETT